MKFNFICCVVCIIALLCSCQTTEDANVPTLKVSDLEFVGKMHNDFMTNIKDNFNLESHNIQLSKKECIDSILAFNLKYLEAQPFEKEIKQMAKQDFIKFKNLVDNENFEKSISKIESRNSNTSKQTIEEIAQDSIIYLDDLPTLKSLINQAYFQGIFDKDSYNIYSEIISLIEESNAGLISDKTLENKIEDIENKFDKLEYNKESPVGVNTASVISVSKASLKWWNENPDAFLAEDKLPHVVAADIAGALVGGISNLTSQLYGGKGRPYKFQFDTLIISCGVGAIAGSCGLAGRVIKHLRELL